MKAECYHPMITVDNTLPEVECYQGVITVDNTLLDFSQNSYSKTLKAECYHPLITVDNTLDLDDCYHDRYRGGGDGVPDPTAARRACA